MKKRLLLIVGILIALIAIWLSLKGLPVMRGWMHKNHETQASGVLN